MKQQKALTLKTLTKSNVWEVQENDILRMLESAERMPTSRIIEDIFLTSYEALLKSKR